MLFAEMPLLQTKLEVPPPPAYALTREHLIVLLPGTRLLLLSAPAGFGKTTLLASWCRALQAGNGTAVAWLALDEHDNDPARFLAYLVTALQQSLAPLPQGDALLVWPDMRGASADITLTQLINAIAACARDVALVLDDYHCIHTPAVHAAVAFLLEHLPHRACIAIGSRADPPLPLARLRACAACRASLGRSALYNR